MQVVQNEQHYHHEADKEGDEAIARFSSFTWSPLSTQLRTEYVRRITVTNVEYSGYRFGLSFHDVNRQRIVNNEKAPMRILNY